jgi:hypothetical protein
VKSVMRGVSRRALAFDRREHKILYKSKSYMSIKQSGWKLLPAGAWRGAGLVPTAPRRYAGN